MNGQPVWRGASVGGKSTSLTPFQLSAVFSARTLSSSCTTGDRWYNKTVSYCIQ